MTVRVGVIGLGMIGRDHIRRLTSVLMGSEVVAVTDIDSERARAVSGALPGVRIHPTGQDLITNDEVDGVLVASWGQTPEEFVPIASHLRIPSPGADQVLCDVVWIATRTWSCDRSPWLWCSLLVVVVLVMRRGR